MSGAHEFLEDDIPRDRQPGFWPGYVEPTPMARAIQMPLSDPHWQNRVLNAYVSRKPAGREALSHKEPT